jgi:hypothetical protein
MLASGVLEKACVGERETERADIMASWGRMERGMGVESAKRG